MANKNKGVLGRELSTVEKVLLVVLAVLIIIAAYYYLVIKNANDTITSAQDELVTVQDEITLQQAVSANRVSMEKKLDALEDGQTLAEVRTYDNFQAEFDELSSVLNSAKKYDLSFATPTLYNNTIRRLVEVTYVTGDDYNQALDIAKQIADGPYRCDVTAISQSRAKVKNSSSNSEEYEITTKLTVKYYETAEGASNLSGLEQIDELDD